MPVYLCHKSCNLSWSCDWLNNGDLCFGIPKIHKPEINAKNCCVRQCIYFLAKADKLQWLLQSEYLIEVLGRQGVLWHFIPKCASWYGGWWERLIGLTKMSLKKMLGRSSHLTSRPNFSSWSRGNSQWSASDTCLPWLKWCRTFDSNLFVTWSQNYSMLLPHEEVGEEDQEDQSFGDSTDVNRQARLQAFLLGQFHSRWKHEIHLTQRTSSSNCYQQSEDQDKWYSLST